ncbi:MAG TPA: DUF1684 domain-containing protein [Candidatus Limnocylindria bacterium]
MTPEEHAAAVRQWREVRDERLRSPDGWLTLVGLYWLEQGENRLGSDPSSPIFLPGSGRPAAAGTIVVEGDAARLVDAAPELRVAGAAAADGPLADDRSEEPTVLELGDLRMFVICRGGDRLALRVRDRVAPALEAFTGIQHFPIDIGWRVTGRLEPEESDEPMEIVDVTGIVTREASPGRVAFERDGQTWRLRALDGGNGKLWLVFGDATNGGETYGGGRFLYTEPVGADGSVVADFNLAYNPPCVFSPYATCPLPAAENRMPLRIEAGELLYRAGHPTG